MQKLKILLIFSLFLSIHPIALAEEEEANFTYIDAITLGVVQGITEFLPIVSTGHLILTKHWLRLDNPTPVQNKAGIYLMISGRMYTKKDAANSYAIVIEGGTILAVVFLYWKNIISILIGILGRDPNGLRLAKNLMCAFIPAAIVGLLLHKRIEAYLFDSKLVVFYINFSTKLV